MVDKPCDKDDSTKSQQVVWEHLKKKKRHCVCKHCGKTFVYHGGTSNLYSHLKNAHRNLWLTSDGDEEPQKPSVLIHTL